MTIDQSVHLRSRRLTGRIGAEISGVDLADLRDDEVGAIRQELLSHRVVFFREQRIGSAEHLALAARLGPLTFGHPTLPKFTEDREVFDLDSIAGASANHWHTDVTFVERPPIFSVLRALIIPEVGGDTLWANTVAAYGDLPEDLRQLADQLVAVHSNGHDSGRVRCRPDCVAIAAGAACRSAGLRVGGLRDRDPVVRVHPETGEPLCSSGDLAQRLVGHSLSESVDLIRISAGLRDEAGEHRSVALARRRRCHLGQPGDAALRHRRLRLGTPEDAAGDHCGDSRGGSRRQDEPGSPGGRKSLLPRSLSRTRRTDGDQCALVPPTSGDSRNVVPGWGPSSAGIWST